MPRAPGLMLADPTRPPLRLPVTRTWRDFQLVGEPATLIVQHVQEGQIVLLHEAFQHSTVRGVELEHHHAGVGCIVGTRCTLSAPLVHFPATDQTSQSKVQQSRGGHQGDRFHGGLRHHAPVGSGHRQAFLLCQRLGKGLRCIFRSIGRRVQQEQTAVPTPAREERA